MEPQREMSDGSSNAVGLEERLGIILVLLLCVIVLASLVLVHMLGTDGEHVVRSLVCIAPAAAVSLIGIYLLTHMYWPLARGIYDPIYVIQVWVLALFITVMILETFAALTTLLWDRGLLLSTSALDPSLWTAEKLYIWQIAKAIPVLKVTETLGWKAPVGFADHWSGLLLLTFEIVLLVPLLGIVTASYELLRSRNMETEAPKEEDHEPIDSEPSSFLMTIYEVVGGALQILATLVWWLFKIVLMTPILAFAVILFLVNRSSPFNRWLESLSGMPWMPDLARIVGFVCILALAAWAIFTAIFDPRQEGAKFIKQGGDPQFLVTILIPRIKCFIVLALAACATTIVFLPSGVTHTVGVLRPTDEVSATAQWYFWHLADTIPFVQAPQILNWSLNFEFVDPLSRVLLLVLKTGLVVLLFLPVMYLFEVSKRSGDSEGNGVAPGQPK
jgi:hypothetical protein